MSGLPGIINHGLCTMAFTSAGGALTEWQAARSSGYALAVTAKPAPDPGHRDGVLQVGFGRRSHVVLVRTARSVTWSSRTARGHRSINESSRPTIELVGILNSMGSLGRLAAIITEQTRHRP